MLGKLKSQYVTPATYRNINIKNNQVSIKITIYFFFFFFFFKKCWNLSSLTLVISLIYAECQVGLLHMEMVYYFLDVRMW